MVSVPERIGIRERISSAVMAVKLTSVMAMRAVKLISVITGMDEKLISVMVGEQYVEIMSREISRDHEQRDF